MQPVLFTRRLRCGTSRHQLSGVCAVAWMLSCSEPSRPTESDTARAFGDAPPASSNSDRAPPTVTQSAEPPNPASPAVAGDPVSSLEVEGASAVAPPLSASPTENETPVGESVPAPEPAPPEPVPDPEPIFEPPPEEPVPEEPLPSPLPPAPVDFARDCKSIVPPPGTQVSGDVWGVLQKKHSPYLVVGNLEVPKGRTLRVEPGVQLRFQGYYKLDVRGALDARGSAAEPILITADTCAGWAGLRFPGPSRIDVFADSWLEHCVLELGTKNADAPGDDATYLSEGNAYAASRAGALYVFGAERLHVRHNLFRFNTSRDKCGAAMFLNVTSGVDLVDNVFEDNEAPAEGGAVCFTHGAIATTHTVVGGAFLRNRSNGRRGGAIYAFDTRVSIADDVLFDSNFPDDYGGLYAVFFH